MQLSTVEKGGATVFPYLGVYIPPVKGTAVFWFNLKTFGQEDFYTKHAACPVLLGNKWIATRWIREYGNEFRRPCVPEESDEVDWENVEREVY